MRSLAQTAILSLVNAWCYLRHPVVMVNAVARAKVVLRPATPVTITEKFLWRKLFDRNPLFTLACDKLIAKAYAIEKCPELKTASVLWEGTDPEQIPNKLLNSCAVLKANHGSGWNVLDLGCRTPSELREQARNWMQRTYGWRIGEWGYRNARKKIIVEQALRVDGQLVQEEYKFHVSCGTTAYVFVKLGQNNAPASKLVLNRAGTAFTIDDAGVRQRSDLPTPKLYSQMLQIAERLAVGFDFVRCDFYGMPDGIYFSELTVYPMSGHGNIGHRELTGLRNSLWDLRKSWFLATPQGGLAAIYADSLRKWLDARDG